MLSFLTGATLSFSFLSIGDWGNSNAKKVSGDMGKYSPEFILSLGDNFYSKGVKSVDDPQFKSTFEEQFTAPSLDVPWYVCAGNHDYYGGDKGIEAEIAYSAKSSRWKFPDYYFAQDITAADGTTITLLSVDTWRLNGGDTYVAHDLHRRRSALRVPTAEIERRHQAGEIDTPLRDVLLENYKDEDPNDPIVLRDDPDQLTWIDTTLAASTADWKIVMGHFPIHSCTTGEHGDTKALISKLQPILEKNKVDMYMNGHDHILQHIQLDGVNYFGSGAGAQEHSGINKGYKGFMGAATGKYGFMLHEGSKTSLKTTFVQQGGGTPYTYTINKGDGLVEASLPSAA